jgi:hypothetical protein
MAGLIIQVPRGSAVERGLAERPPQSGIVVEALATEPAAGEVVLSVPSPEALARDADEVRRVIARAGTGTEPLVVAIEAAEELREDELAAVLEASGRTPRAVILRVARGV